MIYGFKIENELPEPVVPTVTVGSTGSGNSFSILNPYITLNYIIKY